VTRVAKKIGSLGSGDGAGACRCPSRARNALASAASRAQERRPRSGARFRRPFRRARAPAASPAGGGRPQVVGTRGAARAGVGGTEGSIDTAVQPATGGAGVPSVTAGNGSAAPEDLSARTALTSLAVGTSVVLAGRGDGRTGQCCRRSLDRTAEPVRIASGVATVLPGALEPSWGIRPRDAWDATGSTLGTISQGRTVAFHKWFPFVTDATNGSSASRCLRPKVVV